MPETHPPTRPTSNKDTPHFKDADEAERRGEQKRRAKRRTRDPRAADVGLDSVETETRSQGVGFAQERRPADIEHKTGRLDDGSAV
jgi:hypothetical protein